MSHKFLMSNSVESIKFQIIFFTFIDIEYFSSEESIIEQLIKENIDKYIIKEKVLRIENDKIVVKLNNNLNINLLQKYLKHREQKKKIKKENNTRPSRTSTDTRKSNIYEEEIEAEDEAARKEAEAERQLNTTEKVPLPGEQKVINEIYEYPQYINNDKPIIGPHQDRIISSNGIVQLHDILKAFKNEEINEKFEIIEKIKNEFPNFIKEPINLEYMDKSDTRDLKFIYEKLKEEADKGKKEEDDRKKKEAERNIDSDDDSIYDFDNLKSYKGGGSYNNIDITNTLQDIF